MPKTYSALQLEQLFQTLYNSFLKLPARIDRQFEDYAICLLCKRIVEKQDKCNCVTLKRTKKKMEKSGNVTIKYAKATKKSY